MILIDMTYSRPPVTALRARGYNGKHITPTKYRNYKKKLATAIRAQYIHIAERVPPVGNPKRPDYLKNNRYGLIMLAHRDINRGDSDNYLKAIKDAIQDSGVIGDDSQIDFDYVGKLKDKDHPRVEFMLVCLPSGDSAIHQTIVLLYRILRYFFSMGGSVGNLLSQDFKQWYDLNYK